MNTSNQTQQQQQRHKPAQATSKAGRALFALGAVVATPAALEVLRAAEVSFLSLLSRHVKGDWGNTDHGENDEALANGWRLLSSYCVGEDAPRVWLITEADRSQTTVLLPSDY